MKPNGDQLDYFLIDENDSLHRESNNAPGFKIVWSYHYYWNLWF